MNAAKVTVGLAVTGIAVSVILGFGPLMPDAKDIVGKRVDKLEDQAAKDPNGKAARYFKELRKSGFVERAENGGRRKAQ